MKFKTNLKLKSNIIDPVPFVNVIGLFIVFFVLATRFIGSPGLIVELPEVEQSELYSTDCAVISLTEEKILLNNKEIDIDGFREALSGINPQLVAIKADKDIPHSRITEIIALVRQAGIRRIAIAANSGEK